MSSPLSPALKRAYCRKPRVWLDLSSLTFALFIAGCGGSDDPPPAYNRVRTQTVEALIRAIQDKHPEQAIRQMDRMAEFSDEQSFITYLKRQEQKRLLIQKLNPLLEDGELEQAEEMINQHIQTYGIGRFAEKSLELMRELTALRAFPQLVPDTDSASIKEELNQELISELEMIGDSEAVQDWLDRQRAAIELLHQAEIDNKAASLLLETDQKLAIGKQTAIPEILTELEKLRPRHLFFKLQSQLALEPAPVKSESPPLTPDGFEGDEELFLYCLELVLLYDWEETDRRGQDFAEQVWDHLKLHEPMSVTGLALRARLTAKLNKPGETISYLLRFEAAGGIPDHDFYRAMVAKYILPPDQVLTRPWPIPFPMATDIIMRVNKIVEDDGTKGGF